jgi:hypothetical protein
VPAFVGYTQKASLNKKDITNVPVRISSFGEFLMYFGGAPAPKYELVNIRDLDPNRVFDVKPESGRYMLFYCMKHFFANGGSDCYIVSIGSYGQKVSKADFFGEVEVKDESGNTIDTKPIGIDTLKKGARTNAPGYP